MKLRHMKQSDPEEHIASARSAFSRKGNVIASILFAMLCVLFFLPVLLVLILMCPIAYALSRKRFRLRRGILIFLMIPMLFSGGLVSTYMVNTQIFHLQNTYLALILPGLCSTWYIMILRNFLDCAIGFPDRSGNARRRLVFTAGALYNTAHASSHHRHDLYPSARQHSGIRFRSLLPGSDELQFPADGDSDTGRICIQGIDAAGELQLFSCSILSAESRRLRAASASERNYPKDR